MVDSTITDFSKSRIILSIGGSVSYPEYFIIGTGSSTVGSTDTALTTAYDRQLFTDTSYPASSGVTFQGDWNVAEISGVSLTEWGLIPSGGALTGSIWTRHYTDAITFDGTNELRIIETLVFG